jgi:hypothetical protein
MGGANVGAAECLTITSTATATTLRLRLHSAATRAVGVEAVEKPQNCRLRLLGLSKQARSLRHASLQEFVSGL